MHVDKSALPILSFKAAKQLLDLSWTPSENPSLQDSIAAFQKWNTVLGWDADLSALEAMPALFFSLYCLNWWCAGLRISIHLSSRARADDTILFPVWVSSSRKTHRFMYDDHIPGNLHTISKHLTGRENNKTLSNWNRKYLFSVIWNKIGIPMFSVAQPMISIGFH